MDNATHIENKNADQMHELARWDRQGHPLNANAAMADAYEALSRLRARQPDPDDLNQALQGLAKFGALVDVEGLERQIERLIDDRAEIRRQRDEAWDRIEELEADKVAASQSLETVYEMLIDWSQYAPEWAADKHDLSGDIDEASDLMTNLKRSAALENSNG